MRSAPSRPARDAGVVIPIRAFSLGKARLAETLDAPERARLAEHMADRVLRAAGTLPVVVVSSAPEVRAWARDHEVVLVDDPGGLDEAATSGLAWCASRGLARAIVVHADLPLAPDGGLARYAEDSTRPIVTLVPCHRDDGTPVLSVPIAPAFPFAYGPGSFRRHGAAARRLGLALRVVRDLAFGFDVDVPTDLDGLLSGAASRQ